MKKFNKKIIITVLALLVSISTMAGATFAWFSMNKQVKLATVNVVSTAPTNMVISTDAIHWYSGVVAETEVIGGFSPVSTTDGRNFFALADTTNLYTVGGRVNEDGLSIDNLGRVVNSNAVKFHEVEEQLDDGNHYYACFPLYIKASKAVNIDRDLHCFLTELKISSDDPNLKIDNVVRVSITEVAARNTPVDVHQVGSDAVVTSSATIPVGSSGTNIYKTDSSAVLPIESLDSNGVATLHAEDPALTLPNNERPAFTLDYTGEEYTAIIVRIWLEGQHIDCVNAIQGKTISVSLGWMVDNIEA